MHRADRDRPGSGRARSYVVPPRRCYCTMTVAPIWIAKAFGLTLPPTLLALADEVIE